jgi:hypothetical protein
MPRERRYDFCLEDLNDIMDGIAARRAAAASAEPMTRPDYRAKKHGRPVRVKHGRRMDKRALLNAEGV